MMNTDDGPGTNLQSALISAVVTRISAVEDTSNVALTVMEGKVDSTRVALDCQLSSTTKNLEDNFNEAG
jgi:hypothetical protein